MLMIGSSTCFVDSSSGFFGTQQKPSETLAPMVFLLASDRQVSTLPLQPIKLEMLGELLS
jgi:hypothetical protein